MLSIVSVTITFSEHPDLNRIIKRNAYNPKNPAETIRLLERFDRDPHTKKRFGYAKTDIAIEWENGDIYKMRYDIGDGYSIAYRLSPEKQLKEIIDREQRKGKIVPDYIKSEYEARMEYLKGKAITA